MRPHFLSARELMHRVAAELGVVASELGGLEDVCVATSMAHESLQTFDKLGQTLRALESFLFVAGAEAEGDIAIDAALDAVLLERLRARLSGLRIVKNRADEAEFW